MEKCENQILFEEFLNKKVKIVIDSRDHPIVLTGTILVVSSLFIKFSSDTSDSDSLIAMSKILSVRENGGTNGN